MGNEGEGRGEVQSWGAWVEGESVNEHKEVGGTAAGGAGRGGGGRRSGVQPGCAESGVFVDV